MLWNSKRAIYQIMEGPWNDLVQITHFLSFFRKRSKFSSPLAVLFLTVKLTPAILKPRESQNYSPSSSAIKIFLQAIIKRNAISNARDPIDNIYHIPRFTSHFISIRYPKKNKSSFFLSAIFLYYIGVSIKITLSHPAENTPQAKPHRTSKKKDYQKNFGDFVKIQKPHFSRFPENYWKLPFLYIWDKKKVLKNKS